MSERSFRRAQARRAAAQARRDALLRRAGLLAGATAGATALLTASAHADSFLVTSLADGPADACDTSCTLRDAVTAANALPAADNTITFASGLSGTIHLTAGQLAVTGPRLAVTGPGADALTITGDGASRLLDFAVADQDGGGAFAVSGLTLTGGSAYSGGAIRTQNYADLTVSDAVLTGNAATGAGAGANGGAIAVNEGSITVTRSTLTGNHADNGSGGALFLEGQRTGPISQLSRSTTTISRSTITGNAARSAGGMAQLGTLDLADSTIAGNTATSYAGGLLSAGDATVARTTIAGNTAGAAGGALLAVLGRSSVSDSTISGNTTTGVDPGAPFAGGAGVFVSGVYKYGGDLTVSRSTLSGNDAQPSDGDVPLESSGGGLALSGGGGGAVHLLQSTVSGNTADMGAGVSVAGKYDDTFDTGLGVVDVAGTTIAANTARIAGGGVALQSVPAPSVGLRRAAGEDAASPTATVALTSSVVADNTAAGAAQDLSTDGTADTAGGIDSFFSLVETPGSVPFRSAVASLTGVDAQLGPLADNGGPTLTQAPSGTSPLIDQGKAAAGVATDQRGADRIVDTGVPNPPDGDGADIGAVELPGSAVTGTGATGGQPPVVTPAPPPARGPGFTATVRGRGIANRDQDGKPSVLPINATGVACSVTTGTIRVCSVELRAPVSFSIPGSRRRVARGALLGSGVSTAPGKSAVLVRIRLSAAGRALLGRRPLGVPALVTAKAQTSTGVHGATGAVRLLRTNAIRIAVPTRSATLPAAILRQLDAAAVVFRRSVRVTCDAFTDDGPGSLALTRLQAQGACRRLLAAGVEARPTSRGHSTTHPLVRPTPAGRLANRRIVVRFLF
jgi:CSLREA domain-containing protein